MNTIMPIYIVDNTFTIERSEGIGYVQNYFDYDKYKIHLINMERISGKTEGDPCLVKYHFEVLTNELSEITFVEDMHHVKYTTVYSIK